MTLIRVFDLHRPPSAAHLSYVSLFLLSAYCRLPTAYCFLLSAFCFPVSSRETKVSLSTLDGV